MENSFQWNNLLRKFFDLLLIFGPNLAFISQISKFRLSKSNEGFSKKISLFILVANIFRIFFWYGKRFDYSLLFQSIVSILMQIFLLYECIKVSPKKFEENIKIKESDKEENLERIDLFKINVEDDMEIKEEYISIKNKKNEENESDKKVEINDNKDKEKKEKSNKKDKETVINLIKCNNDFIKTLSEKGNFDDILNPKLFWEWPYLVDYIFFLLFLSIIITIAFSVFGLTNEIFIESLGYIGMFFESLVGVPQIIENFSSKSTKNLSFIMIAIWLTGDSLKTLYFLQFNSPIQLIVTGLIQIILDCVIIFQMKYYK